MQIPDALVPEIYQTVKQIVDKSLRRGDGVRRIAETSRINESTAGDFVHMMSRMLAGKRFTRNSSAYITDYFLLRISEDYGPPALQRALTALKLHIGYYRAKRGAPLRKLQAVYDRYATAPSPQTITHKQEEQEQETILAQLKQQPWSKEKIVAKLKQLTPRTSKWVTLNGQRYSRDNYTVALLKTLRDFRCQLCGVTIPKANGSFYIEAAHVTPKRELGEESPANILILCPNHHKEFDYGKTTVIESYDGVQFTLNGKLYRVSLAIE